MRKPCQGESPATPSLKTPSFHPRAKARREIQCAFVTCMEKPSCFLWFARVGFERAWQYCFTLSLMVPTGRPRAVGLQLRLSWCSMGRARKEPSHSRLGCNWRYSSSVSPVTLAPLQSWKPTSMWSLWFWNMYFYSLAPLVFIAERFWLGIQNLRNLIQGNCQDILVFLSNNLHNRSRRCFMCLWHVFGVLQGYQLDPELIPQPYQWSFLEEERGRARKRNNSRTECQEFCLPEDASAGTSCSAPALLY